MPPVARHDCYCKPAFRAREQCIKKYYRSRQFVMSSVSIFVRAHYPVNAVTVEHAKTSWRICGVDRGVDISRKSVRFWITIARAKERASARSAPHRSSDQLVFAALYR
jgi:hypothetical protein